MGLFGDILGSAVGVLGDIWSADRANDAQSDLQRQSYEYQKESMQNRHQWEVEDLRKAGLNPILSATNSAGGVISTGSGQAAKADVSKALSSVLTAFTNSAIGQNSIKISNKDAETRRIDAEANMIRAENDQRRTPSAIALQSTAARLNLKNMINIDRNYELQKIYNEAQVSKINQDIINSVAEVKARIQYLEVTGQAAATSASAAVMQGSAALQNAESQRLIAEVADKNGVSVRELNDALAGRATGELRESMERVEDIIQRRHIREYKYPRATGNDVDDFGQAVYQLGDYLGALNPIKFNFGGD